MSLHERHGVCVSTCSQHTVPFMKRENELDVFELSCNKLRVHTSTSPHSHSPLEQKVHFIAHGSSVYVHVFVRASDWCSCVHAGSLHAGHLEVDGHVVCVH